MIEMWSEDTIKAFRETLLAWYDTEGRDQLPWRKDQEPYHVWVSEIMLQQTQVNTVIPYYERFMTMFPTVKDLAEAPEQSILKAWEGLGYYSRVRNMQKAAQQIMNDHAGIWPDNMKDLLDLKGIGPYTAAAVASIAFKEPVAAIDGNAFRVYARLFKIDADIAQPKTRNLFFDLGNELIDPVRPGDFNQAIMDLGSSFMSAKNYDSEKSPVKAFNAAYADGTEDFYPVKTKAKKAKPITYFAVSIETPDGYLWEQRPETGLLANFWTMPLYNVNEFIGDTDAKWTVDEMIAATQKRILQDYGVEVTLTAVAGKPVTHIYTHQKWTVTILTGRLNETQDLLRGDWRKMDDLMADPQPKIQEKIWQKMLTDN
ncbi:A/G-specific adenine glycosylase [Weissella tructae]|uniref:Adenine DNA glycosylase n=2 Tax=Weissella TaxID=46255 RepID=A0A075U0R4_9LACO|nr:MULTISPECIES: A/G-specific adenine glycosylase [Weissella]AIG66135.1 A/G-specific adenine glycosylase [Weissella tructae]AIM63517.1 A/G-specific adenine glycosylase [Weissella ceti]AIM64852.1 A/G-specific adenine glycosylase [Weissella ceti]ELA07510.1 A/G-specific adenine glycosylase [Weissella ceti NC36]QVV91286.1 A/G-specific adenine glycosylase [Weissella tructae]